MYIIINKKSYNNIDWNAKLQKGDKQGIFFIEKLSEKEYLIQLSDAIAAALIEFRQKLSDSLDESFTLQQAANIWFSGAFEEVMSGIIPQFSQIIRSNN